jgi:hypothetical protein
MTVSRRSAEVEVRYQIKPIELGEADLADVRICNEYDESVVRRVKFEGRSVTCSNASLFRSAVPSAAKG